MTPNEILQAFSSDLRAFPQEAVAAARADKEAVTPVFLELFENYLNGTDDSEQAESALFLVIHILGEFREKRAFQLLLRLLSEDNEQAEYLLGDGVTETLSGILMNTFDSDTSGLCKLILNTRADVYVRGAAIDALAYLTAIKTIPREETERFLEKCYFSLIEEKPDFVLVAWVQAISMLGWEAFSPRVEETFRKGLIDRFEMNIGDYQKVLQIAKDDPDGLAGFADRRIAPFTNVDRLASWAAFKPEREHDGLFEDWDDFDRDETEPYINPYRNIGRNDPCPCGSGKKFKKCCLN